MTPIESAWLAGLYEGEGTLVFKMDKRKPNSSSWALSITMTDEDVIRRVAEVSGVGRVRFRAGRKDGWKDQWLWYVSVRRDIERLVKEIGPMLGCRRQARFQEFADWCATYPPAEWVNREVADGMKFCPACETVKPLDAFYKVAGRRGDGRSGYCQPCVRAKRNASR